MCAEMTRRLEGTKARKLHYLLAYDGSEHARAGVSLLLDLPNQSGISPVSCAVTLISVLPTQSIGGHEAMQVALDLEKERLQQAGFETQAILKAGNPAATINDYAEEIQADLIIIGARGLRAALGILLGGVAQQVVEYSSSPVLVVRAPYKGLRRILLVVDGSEGSQHAVEFLAPPCPDGKRQRCAMFPTSAAMSLMHVLPPPINPEASMRAWALGPEALYPTPITPIDKEAVEAAEQRRGEQLLKETASLLRLAEIETRQVLVRGDAADQIIHEIRRDEVDLVVCGSRGLSAITGWLLGSVSRKLVHYAGCSVLIVK